MTPESYWQARARRLVLRHNFARWLEWFWPGMVSLALVASVVELLLRQGHFSTVGVGRGFAFLAAAVGLVALAPMRRRPFSRAQALVRLEEEGHLHNRLTAARQGVGPWPEPRAVRDPARWRWGRLVAPGAGAAALFLAAAWIPLPRSEARSIPPEPPLAWSELQPWLNNLEKARVADPPALEKVKQELAELQQQPAEKWFRQSSLEAGESLRDQTQKAIGEMQRNLTETDQVLQEAQQASVQGTTLRPEELEKMAGLLAQALEGLQSGNLPLNREMLKQLKDLNPESLRQLTPDQLDALQQRLKLGEQVCRQCLNPNGIPHPYETGEDQVPGGPGGGGETKPLNFNKPESERLGQKREELTSQDLSNALPADLEGISAGQHDVKKVAAGPVAGGNIAGAGTGGDAVWRESALPQEKAVLERFFK